MFKLYGKENGNTSFGFGRILFRISSIIFNCMIIRISEKTSCSDIQSS